MHWSPVNVSGSDVFMARLPCYFKNKSMTGTMRMFSHLILNGKAQMALSSARTASGLGKVQAIRLGAPASCGTPLRH